MVLVIVCVLLMLPIFLLTSRRVAMVFLRPLGKQLFEPGQGLVQVRLCRIVDRLLVPYGA